MDDFVRNVVVLLVPPFQTTRRGWLHACFLYPLQCVEAMLIRPVSQLRRHMPLVGGVCVICLTLWSLCLRSVWRHFYQMLTTLTTTHHARFNFDAFWGAIDRYYVLTDATSCNWSLVHSIYGDKIEASTSQEDLWTAIHDSMALLGDPSVRLLHPTASGVAPAIPDAPSLQARIAALEDLFPNPPLQVVANRLVWGLLNPSIGYLNLSALAGFVELSFPLDYFASPSSPQQVPEMYDLETMRWALHALLHHSRTLGLQGLILDLRWNCGGGSHLSVLTAAACFQPPKTPAFSIEEEMKSWGQVRRRTFTIPSSSERYDGPLVVLQGPETAGTAELLLLALQSRRRTVFVGTPTAGKLSDVMQVQLPNGWVVEMPYQQCIATDGERYQGRGIPPQTLVVNQSDDAVLSMALQCFEHL
ncbi:unnamed protein product [Aphanomyces euteiches]